MMKSIKWFLPVFFLVTFMGCDALNNEDNLNPTLVWVEHTAGPQCGQLIYMDVEDAIEDFKSEKIKIYSSKKISRPVCAACGCPSSTFYQLKIDSLQLQQAEELGWRLLNQ